jgi:hypothetical protein
MSFIDLKNRFSFAQMTSNADGKTSSSGTMGCLIIATGCFGFLCGVGDFIWMTQKPDIMMYSTGFIGAGATLLGVRKSKDSGKLEDSVYAETEAPKPEDPKQEEMLKS